MKITIESTEEITTIDGAPVRVWEGTTERKVKCHVFVSRIGFMLPDDPDETNYDEFRQLIETPPPAELVDVAQHADELTKARLEAAVHSQRADQLAQELIGVRRLLEVLKTVAGSHATDLARNFAAREQRGEQLDLAEFVRNRGAR